MKKKAEQKNVGGGSEGGGKIKWFYIAASKIHWRMWEKKSEASPWWSNKKGKIKL